MFVTRISKRAWRCPREYEVVDRPGKACKPYYCIADV